MVVALSMFGRFGGFRGTGRVRRSCEFGIEKEEGRAISVVTDGASGESTNDIVEFVGLGWDVVFATFGACFAAVMGAESVGSIFAIFVRRPGISFTITT